MNVINIFRKLYILEIIYNYLKSILQKRKLIFIIYISFDQKQMIHYRIKFVNKILIKMKKKTF